MLRERLSVTRSVTHADRVAPVVMVRPSTVGWRRAGANWFLFPAGLEGVSGNVNRKHLEEFAQLWKERDDPDKIREHVTSIATRLGLLRASPLVARVPVEHADGHALDLTWASGTGPESLREWRDEAGHVFAVRELLKLRHQLEQAGKNGQWAEAMGKLKKRSRWRASRLTDATDDPNDPRGPMAVDYSEAFLADPIAGDAVFDLVLPWNGRPVEAAATITRRAHAVIRARLGVPQPVLLSDGLAFQFAGLRSGLWLEMARIWLRRSDPPRERCQRAGCSNDLPRRGARFCSNACRQRDYRRREADSAVTAAERDRTRPKS